MPIARFACAPLRSLASWFISSTPSRRMWEHSFAHAAQVRVVYAGASERCRDDRLGRIHVMLCGEHVFDEPRSWNVMRGPRG